MLYSVYFIFLFITSVNTLSYFQSLLNETKELQPVPPC